MKIDEIQRRRAPLDEGDARSLRGWLEEDEAGALEESGLSRMGLYRAAAGGVCNAATRAVLRSALARRDAA